MRPQYRYNAAEAIHTLEETALSTQHFECHIDITQGDDNAVDLLAETSGLTKQRIKSAMQKGAVWLTSGKHTQRLRRHSKAMKAGDKLHLYYDEKILETMPPEARLIADEEAYSVWYKPYGMLSQGSKWSDHCTINRWAEQHLTPQRNAFIVHRLDRAASGLILIAHRKSAAQALSKLFQERAVTKHYQVIVHGHFPDLESPQLIETELDGKPARSHAKLIKYSAWTKRSLLEVSIETGRKHQVRRHLCDTGFPVVGDRLYGDDGDSEDLQLTACHLAFTCPISQQEKVFDLPEELGLSL